MATLSNNHGLRSIQFPFNGKRRTIYLGYVSESMARGVIGHINELLNAIALQQPMASATASWLHGIDAETHDKLSRTGILKPRKSSNAATIGTYPLEYIARRTDLKEATIRELEQCRRALLLYFPADREMKSFQPFEFKDWQRFLKQTLATATIAGHTAKARQIFADAAERGVIDGNPLDGIKLGSQVNESRKEYVPSGDIKSVIDKCPDHEWKMIFALARFGGLRIPSELFELTWADIDFARGKILVRSPKTAHHEGHETRTIPLFKELRPFLEDGFALAPAGDVHVIANHRIANLRTTAHKIIRRAGLEPWEKTFVNLRASCQTDLLLAFPITVVCIWIGNSALVAKKHYAMVRESDFAAASGCVGDGAANHAASSGEIGGVPSAADAERMLLSLVESKENTPGKGRTPPADIGRLLNTAHRTLQKGLRGAVLRLAETDKADIAFIEHLIADARGRS